VTISVTIKPVPRRVRWAESSEDMPPWEQLAPWRGFPRLVRADDPLTSPPETKRGRGGSAVNALLGVAQAVLEGLLPPEDPTSETRKAVVRAARVGILSPDRTVTFDATGSPSAVEDPDRTPSALDDTLEWWLRAAAHVWALSKLVESALEGGPLPLGAEFLPDQDHSSLELLAQSSSPLRREFFAVVREVTQRTSAVFVSIETPRKRDGTEGELPRASVRGLIRSGLAKPLTGSRLRQALLLELSKQHPGFQVQPGQTKVELRAGLFHVALVELSHQLQQRRKVRVCRVCGQRFLARGGAKTCSPKCRQALSRLQRRSEPG
jgi:hypothetical protein